MHPAAELELRGVSMTFPHGRGRLFALESIDLSLAPSQFVTVVGPNGCGKTTLVRLIAGLAAPTEGDILHRGHPVAGPDRSRLLMFQQPTLFPWMTVYRNLDFALRANGVPSRRRRAVIEQYLALVGLDGFAKSFPRQLSVGMLQRAELARALAVRPRVLLLDEPFASLDALSRLLLQEDLMRFRSHGNTAFIMVTHDVREAVFLGDQVALMTRRPGRIKRIVDLPWTGPRPASVRHAPRFSALCDEILEGLREELDVGEGVHRRAETATG